MTIFLSSSFFGEVDDMDEDMMSLRTLTASDDVAVGGTHRTVCITTGRFISLETREKALTKDHSLNALEVPLVRSPTLLTVFNLGWSESPTSLLPHLSSDLHEDFTQQV